MEEGRASFSLQGKYRYTSQLLHLARRTPAAAAHLPEVLTKIVTPLLWSAWEGALRQLPYIVSGLRSGFRVGFDHSRRRELRATGRNMGSAYEHQEVVSDYVANEREHGRVLGPFCRGSGPPIHTSSFGVIPSATNTTSGS